MNYCEMSKKFGHTSFSRADLLREIKRLKPDYNENSLNKSLARLVERGYFMRVAKGVFVVPQLNRPTYSYEGKYSNIDDIKAFIKTQFPLIDYLVFETVQLNEFFNHQIAVNTIFVETEKEATEAIFESFSEVHASVLFSPSPALYHRYGKNDSIIVRPLPCRYPQNTGDKHGISLEKLIVDLFANELLKDFLNSADYPEAMEEMFLLYQINETKLFRYAKTRRVDAQLLEVLGKAKVKLYTV